MKKILNKFGVGLSALLLLLGFTSFAAASMTGDCNDCHTMHNSENGLPVAQVGTGGATSADPITNLLKLDCIACHANDPTGGAKIWTMTGGSVVPQVMHSDATGDLAGGNFQYIASGGNRKGHNVVDLVSAETDMDLDQPPGFRHKTSEIGSGGFDVDNFTCAGSMGCHGYRGQLLTTIAPDPTCDPEFCIHISGPDIGLPCSDEQCNGATIFRTGVAALSGIDGFPTTELKRGAHHSNYEGLKNDGVDPDFYDSPLAHSYRFIRSLRGYGNEVDRWQNVDEDSHNEYVGGYEDTVIGDILKNTDFGTTSSCSRCHVGGSIGAVNSRLTTPGQSITGFCMTCHGSFHSSGVTNGTSGAFLRHPSDWVIPDRDEYAAYTTYDVSAPVARPHSVFVDGITPSATVTPGTDLVMCLSCHVAHAAPYDYMLRFDYAGMTAGGYADIATATAEGGCLACHTAKGVLPENR